MDGPRGPMMDPNMMPGGPPGHMMGGPMRPGVPGPKGSPMDPSMMGGPNSSPMGIVPGDQDPSMPLPPGGMNPGGVPPGPGPNGGGFSKNSPIMGAPTTNDPNYAQQYHNFQQQLYATNKSSPGGPQFFPGGGGPNGPGIPVGAPGGGPNGGGPPGGVGGPIPGGK